MAVKLKDPFMPLFFGDFLTATTEWTGEQQSLYLLLLAYQWANGSLPADTGQLAIVSRYDRANFLTLWPIMAPKFTSTDGRLRNERLEFHRDKSREIATLRSESGRTGAAARWQTHPKRMATASPNGGKRIKSGGKRNAVATENDGKPHGKTMPSDLFRSDLSPTSSLTSTSSPLQTGRTSKNGRSDPERERERPAEVAKRRNDPGARSALARVGMRPKATP